MTTGTDDVVASPAGSPFDAPRVAPFLAQMRPAVVGFVALTVITGCVFPLTLLVLGRWLWPDQASGSLVRAHGGVVGSRLIGQAFAQPIYFQPRPSAAGAGYDATQSGGSNLGPANPRLASTVRQAAEAFRSRNQLPPGTDLPIDAVTNSGSGLDPEISPEDAALQVRRVAVSRGMAVDRVRRLVIEHTRGRPLGFIGEPGVSVLELNLALDQLAPPRHP
jgi:K+-transporting ATPase ATPase C chain